MEAAIGELVSKFKSYAGAEGSTSTLSRDEFHKLVTSELPNLVGGGLREEDPAGTQAAAQGEEESLDSHTPVMKVACAGSVRVGGRGDQVFLFGNVNPSPLHFHRNPSPASRLLIHPPCVRVVPACERALRLTARSGCARYREAHRSQPVRLSSYQAELFTQCPDKIVVERRNESSVSQAVRGRTSTDQSDDR
ncbi:hypothetical protein WMY93_025639 [Mugilogobius chulae]|uniref:S100/CaBP-9k-type calcium binding subdomain domain-containing protein n=1 Tax=Mugilogobius chulae TaxID=88201 RepID=A0AAW0N4H8_9GOBI